MQAHLCFKPNLEPERQRFGALITIDDGVLQPAAKGFGVHPHHDVEVVTFMMSGEVNHIDPNDASHNGCLKAKGIQIITAGNGIVHNEENNSETEIMRALQIWFTPRAKSLPPSFNRKYIEARSTSPIWFAFSLQMALTRVGWFSKTRKSVMATFATQKA